MTARTDQRIAVIGLGYVGLPLAIAFTEAGLEVEGIDAHGPRVAELAAGRSPIDDISNARLAAALSGGLRVVEPADARLSEADIVFVCVPTPITRSKDPDLGPMLSAAALIREHLQPGQLVILQSTTFPGTTSGPFREELERSGLAAGRDFDLAFAPERVNPGDPASAAKGVPRLVGATTAAATARAGALLRRINDNVLELSSPDAAELAKLLENVFRNVNIALVNQLALLCERMGLDVWEVIDAAATKPFGFMRFTPGPGVGGHCIPVDPYYLSWRAREFDFVDRFVELAGDINFAMPRHVVDLVGEALNERGMALRGARVGVLGVAFKPNVRDARNSPAADVIGGLRGRGATVVYHDPHVPTFRDGTGEVLESASIDDVLGADVVVVVTAHAAVDMDDVYARAALVVDTVNSSGEQGRAAAAGPPARRRVERRLSARRGAGTSPGRDARPRLLRRGSARQARGGVAGRGRPPGRRLRPAPRGATPRPACWKASPSIASTSAATRAPGLPTYLAEYASFLVRAGWALAKAHRRPPLRARPGPHAARLPGVRGAASQARRRPDPARPPRGDAGVLPVPVPAGVESRRPRAAPAHGAGLDRGLHGGGDRQPGDARPAGRSWEPRPTRSVSSRTARRSPGSIRPASPGGPSPRTARVRLVYAGALTPTYEVDVAVEAVAELRAARPELAVAFDVYGRGDAAERLATLARDRGVDDRVTFHGRIPIEDVPLAVARADIGIAPTRRDPFTDVSLSTKLFEYAAMGKPVVASRLPMVEQTFPPGPS